MYAPPAAQQISSWHHFGVRSSRSFQIANWKFTVRSSRRYLHEKRRSRPAPRMKCYRAIQVWLLIALVLTGRLSTASVSVEPNHDDVGDGHAQSKSLKVGIRLTNEHLVIDGAANAYEPIGLKPLQTYELRVSFVSTRSAQIHFGYDCKGTQNSLDGQPKKYVSRNRRLLHAEKLTFSTDELGHVTDHPGCLLTVWVSSWGRLRQKAETTADFFYDIVLEKNLLGVPVSGLPLIGYALFLFAGILVAALRLGEENGPFGWDRVGKMSHTGRKTRLAPVARATDVRIS